MQSPHEPLPDVVSPSAPRPEGARQVVRTDGNSIPSALGIRRGISGPEDQAQPRDRGAPWRIRLLPLHGQDLACSFR